MYKIKISKKYYDYLDKIEEEVLDISAGPFLLETVLESIAQSDERRFEEAKVTKNRKKVFIVSEEMIKRLKAVHREVLTLMFIESKTVAETAIILDINEETVYKKAASALSELLKLLRNELINNPYFEKIVRSGFGEEGIKTIKGYEINDELFELKQGEWLHFKSTLPHTVINKGKGKNSEDKNQTKSKKDKEDKGGEAQFIVIRVA